MAGGRRRGRQERPGAPRASAPGARRARGRPRTDLLRCGQHLRALRIENPAFCPWRSRAALAQAALGRRVAGRELADEELDRARRYGAPSAVGVALRARALIEDGPAALELLAEAVAALAGSQARLSTPAHWSTTGRRCAGRVPAATRARRCEKGSTRPGAAGRCRSPRGRTPSSRRSAAPAQDARRRVEALTPSERRVADLAAGGMANAEIAQSLFVTVKTVETHLGRTYRKLDIPGRGGLAAALASRLRAERRRTRRDVGVDVRGERRCATAPARLRLLGDASHTGSRT